MHDLPAKSLSFQAVTQVQKLCTTALWTRLLIVWAQLPPLHSILIIILVLQLLWDHIQARAVVVLSVCISPLLLGSRPEAIYKSTSALNDAVFIPFAYPSHSTCNKPHGHCLINWHIDTLLCTMYPSNSAMNLCRMLVMLYQEDGSCEV